MGRRSGAGDQPTKAQRRKTAARKSRITSKAVRPRNSSAAREEPEIARLIRERDEALEREKATAEVLRVISSSRGKLEPIFQAMLEKASRLCEASFGNMLLYEEGLLRRVAFHNTPPKYDEYNEKQPLLNPEKVPSLGQLVRTKRPVQVVDMAVTEPESPIHYLGGARTLLVVPMLKEDVLIGCMGIYRKEIRPFTDKQIDLVKNFAAQAVIAIENARLLNELRQRTTDLTERTTELTESLEQQTATSEVLQVISSSPSDLEPVFATMLENAVRICDAKFGNIYRWDGELLHLLAAHNTPPALAKARRDSAIRPGSFMRRMVETKTAAHVVDVAADESYTDERDLNAVSAVELGGVRTLLSVPLVKENELIGSFSLFRQEVHPFTDKQIALVENFAAQAVIAIENTRLLNELREALQQQTATADVLKVISSSPGALEPVFKALLENATQLCGASYGNLWLCEGDAFRSVALHGVFPATYMERWGTGALFRPEPDVPLAQIAKTKQPFQIADIRASQPYRDGNPIALSVVNDAGMLAVLAVPMLKENDLVGAIAIHSKEARPFTDKQIELLENFASQAVIAIENARLLNELRQRTDDLVEALEKQTATSEVLRVVSSSPGDLQPVFEAMLANATRLCAAKFGILWLCEGEGFRCVALHNTPPAFTEQYRREPVIHPVLGTGLRRLFDTRQVAQVADMKAIRPYIERDPFVVTSVELGGYRSVVNVPMLKENELIGAISIYGQEVRSFSDKQIELVHNFAAQAVIAIENARLLNELRQRTGELAQSVGELRALGEVSQAVNSTLDLKTVLSTIVAKAVQLSGTEAGAIYVFDDVQREFHLRATYGMNQELIDALSQQHIGLDERNVALVLAQREPIQVADLQQEPSSDIINQITLRAGFRARLVAPLFRGEDVIGLLVVRRRMPGAFAQSIIDLIKTFAAQSAVAIENARLFQNVETSLEDLRTTQDRLVQTQKLASLGQLTAGIAHEIKNPLNFVNNFSGVSVELIDELQQALEAPQLDNKARAEIAELANTLRGNLDKIVQHGKRADSIVKNMLLHSREGSGEHRPVDINALVEEAVNLAYHGARAENQRFQIDMERSFDPAAGEIDVFPQEITRALLNLISNGFYASTKRKEQDNSEGYKPTLTATTKNLGDRVEIRIRDNGTGISPEVREKLFNPFFTTKPAGEGTGLGLSISHDIIVKQHGGSIEVETEPGAFTEFKVVLPRAGASLIASR